MYKHVFYEIAKSLFGKAATVIYCKDYIHLIDEFRQSLH